MSGAIKNVLDSLYAGKGTPGSHFDERPVGLASYGGPSAINAVNTLQTSVRSMRGSLVPTVVTVSRDALDDAGTITDERACARADKMLAEIATHVAMRRAHEAIAVAV
jgi:NAD(P)H-dependent FMN reductase